ncbi:MAG: RNA-binding cell elongation regulator Jag/EloR [Actinomycetota bacterium]
MTDAVEASGSTVEEAIDRALEMLGATDDEVEVQILSEGGDMVRRDEARVRVKLRDERTHEDLALADDEEEEDDDFEPDPALEGQADAAVAFLEGLVGTMGLEAELSSSTSRDAALVELAGPELALLIGRHGSTLEALQEVTRAAVQRKVGGRAFVNLDVEGYRARRREILERRARSAAAKVRRSGKPQALEPMPAFERKVVHDALTRFGGVQTTSEGEEPNRRIVISPA